MSLIPASGRFRGGGHGYPLQYPCLEKCMDRGAWQTIVHRVAMSRTQLKHLSTAQHMHIVLDTPQRLPQATPLKRPGRRGCLPRNRWGNGGPTLSGPELTNGAAALLSHLQAQASTSSGVDISEGSGQTGRTGQAEEPRPPASKAKEKLGARDRPAK